MIVDFDYSIPWPVGDVFPRMADITRRPQWVTPAMERIPLSDGPIGTGSKYQATDKYPGRRAEFIQEITAYEPNRLLNEAWDGPMAGHMTTRFTDEDGSTRLSVHTVVNPSGALRPVAPLLRGWLVRIFKKDYARFEQMVAAELSRPEAPPPGR